MSRIRDALAALSGLAVAAAVMVGCSQTITGTPQADPAQTGQSQTSTTTTSRTPSTTRPRTPSSTTVPTRTTSPSGTGVAPAGAETTCGEYTGMTETDKQAVIEAIGEDNPLIAEAPEMWTSIADMLCDIAKPSAYVKDVIMGEM